MAGVGDLVACGNHPEHPGYSVGVALAKGQPAPTAAAMAAEAEALVSLAARHRVELPLTGAIVAIARGELEAHLAIDRLMRRGATRE